MPNGYGPAMRAFTKLMKPPSSFLRYEGYSSVIYVNDCYLHGDSFRKCAKNVIRTTDILESLGFYIKMEKSEIIKQQITFLGVIIDSLHMTITLTNEKKQKILKLCTAARLAHTLTIRELAKLIANLVASMEAVPQGRLFYRQREREKIKSLQQNIGNFEAKITLSDLSKKKLTWWKNNIMTATKSLKKLLVDATIYTDASLDGWAAVCEKPETGGMSTKQQQALHINAIELLGAKLGHFSFFKDKKDITYIRVMMDNNTAVAYINNMGGIRSDLCDDIVFDIWQWAAERQIWVSAAHIPGSENVVADKNSRISEWSSEWKLRNSVFKHIVSTFGKPHIDLFASRINHQLSNYISWRPDPWAKAVDAFSVNWSPTYNYCFPPFSIILKVLQKIQQDKAQATVVVPYWTTQNWFLVLLGMLVDHLLIMTH